MARAARADEAQGTRENILRTALDIFSIRGFAGASTRDIASAARVNHGLIRHYFGSKERLWQAAVDQAFADMRVHLDASLRETARDDAREAIAGAIRAHVRYVGRNPAFVRLMLEEGKRRGPRTRWLVDRHVKPLYEALAALLARGRASGVITADIPPVHFFYVLAGAAGTIFHQSEECRRLTGIDPGEPGPLETHARVVERLLLGPSEKERS